MTAPRLAAPLVAPLACLMLTPVWAPMALAAPELTFDVRENVERNPDPTTESDTVQEQSDYRLQVVLGSDYIEYGKASDWHRILDFAQERLLFRDSLEVDYTATSIYADLGFRLYEFQNRLFLKSVMDKVGAGEARRWSAVYPEHLFSLRSEQETELARKETRRMAVFSHDRDVLLRHSLDVEPADRETVGRFVVFLRNAYGVHPDILEALEALEGLPKQLEIARFDYEDARLTLQLKSVSERESALDRSSIRVAARAGEDEVRPVSQQALEASADEREERIDQLVVEATELASQGKALDAMLLFFEYTLCTGEDLPAEFFKHREAIMGDNDVGTLFRSIEASGEEALGRALAELRRLDKLAGPGRRALRIFLANTLTALGESERAKALFLDTLRENPFIAGAWKDLGDIYYGAYDARSAWLCWDTGRILEPSRKLFQQVYEFERTLRADHPGFFLKAGGE